MEHEPLFIKEEVRPAAKRLPHSHSAPTDSPGLAATPGLPVPPVTIRGHFGTSG